MSPASVKQAARKTSKGPTRTTNIKHVHASIWVYQGKSTLDAIVKLKTIVNESRDKYAIDIFVDIKGAFDRVWWPDVLDGLRRVQCPPNLYKLIASYLSNRKANITRCLFPCLAPVHGAAHARKQGTVTDCRSHD